jgi:gas vesicle protein
VGGKADEFAGRIRKMAVGDEAKLVILRGGSRKTVTITTSARPKLDTIKYKYKVDAGDEVVDTQESRGMMLRRGPNGQWQMMPFAPPAQPVPPIAPVPPVPPTPGLAPIPPLDLFRGGWPDVGSTFVIVETQDGATTEIRREANGEIKVSRSKEGDSSKAKVQTYKSVDDLKKGDPEAYAMYRRLRDRSPQVRAWNWSDMGGRIDESVRREMEQAQREIERALAAAQDARRQAQSYARDRHGRPDVRFDVDADGRIKVITRDGDQELVRTFKNADELREKKPKLYERYRRLHEEESEDD